MTHAPTPAVPAAFISLRCPGCRAQVNVQASQESARCYLCNSRWNWKRGAYMTLAVAK